MRIRTPEESPSVELKQPDRSHSVTYKVKVITPIYGGGVKAGEPDMDMPIRASAIRGQLRYWWRFLKMNDPDNPLAGEELFNAERNIWGGMGDDDDGYASKIFIKIKSKPITNNDLIKASELIRNRNGVGYALFSAVQGEEDHKLIKSGYTFECTISYSDLTDEKWESVLQSFRWWVCFGGVGARTRRGLGSIEILNDGFNLVSIEELGKYHCKLEEIEASDAVNAWNKAVGKLHHFRQVEFLYNRDPDQDHANRGVGRRIKKRRGNRDNIQKSYPSQSHWPEPDTIRKIVQNHTQGHKPTHPAKQSFPRAAFGLPIIFEFVNDAPPQKTELIPVLPRDSTDARMGSPIILKAMKINNTYKAIALRMPASHLNTLTVRLKNSGNSNNNNLPKEFTDGSWWNPSKSQDVPPIRDNNATDPLTAFMNYFAKGGK